MQGKLGRAVGRLSVLLVVAGTLVAVQLATAQPALAMSGLEWVSSDSSPTNSVSPKTTQAYCPSNKHVIGGGGWITEFGTDKVRLTQLQPIRLLDGVRDGYQVTAAEAAPGIPETWTLTAYAICATKGISGYEIVPGSSVSTSNPVQTAVADCEGRRVLGTGAKIVNPGSEVGLQVARADGAGGIARAQAHEDPDGYSGVWRVTAYAVCADEPPGYQVVYGESAARDSETVKIATATCPGTKRVHGVGAAITNVAPGNVSLHAVYPFENLREVLARAKENIPTSQDWDFIVVQAICAF